MSFLEGVFGPPDTRELSRRSDVKGLIRALTYRKDWKVRDNAVWELALLGDSRAIEPLIPCLLNDAQSRVRETAARALGRLGNSLAVEPLILALEDKDWGVRMMAAYALGELKDARAIDPLIDRLKDCYGFPHERVTGALAKLGWQPGRDENGASYFIAERAWQKCVEIGEAAVKPLIVALNDPQRDTYVRAHAAETLAQLKDDRCVGPLIAALKDSSAVVRKAAAEALGEISDMRSVEPLIAALNDTAETVRNAAVESLKKASDPRAIEALREYAVRESKKEKQDQLNDTEILSMLRQLCIAYANNWANEIKTLEPLATTIGTILDQRGGIQEMRRIWYQLGDIPGARTLEMHWNGIGDWRG